MDENEDRLRLDPRPEGQDLDCIDERDRTLVNIESKATWQKAIHERTGRHHVTVTPKRTRGKVVWPHWIISSTLRKDRRSRRSGGGTVESLLAENVKGMSVAYGRVYYTFKVADGLIVRSDVLTVDGETLVKNRRMIFAWGTKPHD
jgi:hypothetical protein